MDQLSFGVVGFAAKGKTTRKERFPAEMEAIEIKGVRVIDPCLSALSWKPRDCCRAESHAGHNRAEGVDDSGHARFKRIPEAKSRRPVTADRGTCPDAQ